MKKSKILFLLSLFVILLTVFGNVFAQDTSSPAFRVSSIVSDEKVVLTTKNFPGDTAYTVSMASEDAPDTYTPVAKFNSKSGGSLNVTVKIPEKFQGQNTILVRLSDDQGGVIPGNFVNIPVEEPAEESAEEPVADEPVEEQTEEEPVEEQTEEETPEEPKAEEQISLVNEVSNSAQLNETEEQTEESVDEEPAAEPEAEEPVEEQTEESVDEEPAEEPEAEEPVEEQTEETVDDEPTEEPEAEDPVEQQTEESVEEEPAEEPVAEEPVEEQTEESVDEEPAEEPEAEEPVDETTEESVDDEPAEEPEAEEPVEEQTEETVDDEPAEEPEAEEPVVEEPVVEEVPALVCDFSVIPTVTIDSVVGNESVTFTTANFPANSTFTVSMGYYVATWTPDRPGPEPRRGEPERREPERREPAQERPQGEPVAVNPLLYVMQSYEAQQNVPGFDRKPAGPEPKPNNGTVTTSFSGSAVGSFETGDGSAQTLTFAIPESLKYVNPIALWINDEGSCGFYSYNYFYNNSTF